MDWDDVRPKPKDAALSADDLAKLSIAELEVRIVTLEAEIARAADMLARKRAHEKAASEIFKR